MTSTSRIAVTGFGAVAPGAIGRDAFAETLFAGRPLALSIDRFPTAGMRSTTAALVRDFRPKDFLPVLKMRRMNGLSRMAVVAAKLAVADASLESAGFSRPDVGVAMGTAFGPVQTSIEYLREYLAKGASLAPPQLFAESVANAPGSHVAIENGFEGFNVTFTQRESSAMTALMYACSQILKGSVRAAICGGVDEVNEVLYSVLESIGALACAAEGLAEAARPLDRHRNGMLAGEGAAALVLERGATERHEPIAYISGFGIARDASATISDWGDDPVAVVAAMRAAIEDAGITPDEIDAVFCSANGSVRGDRLEYLAIQRFFGANAPVVVATKGLFGEYAAAGTLQIASALLALREQKVPLSAGFEGAEPEMALRVSSETCPLAMRHVLVNSISAGGGIVCAVFSRGALG